MQLPPLDVIAAWPPPNYANPSEVRGPAILVITVIFVPLLVILVALRTHTRLYLSKNFGADDIAIVAAVFPTMGCAVLSVLAVEYCGWSRHIYDVPADQLVLGLKIGMAIEVLFATGCSLTKISMLLLILRVLAGTQDGLRRLSISVMVVVFLEMIIFNLVVINTCRPVSEYWGLSFAPQNCINETAHLFIAGIINTITDFCVVFIPIPVVLKLKLSLRQRIYCSLIFGAGFIVCIAGGFRIAYTYKLNTTWDKTWLAYPLWISGTIELYLGIIATSLPAIKPFIFRYFPNLLGNHMKSISHSSNARTNQLKSLEPRTLSRSSLINDDDIESLDLSSPKSIGKSENGLEAENEKLKSITKPPISKPKPLSPVVSKFSDYRTASMVTIKAGVGHVMTEWKHSKASLGKPEVREPKILEGEIGETSSTQAGQSAVQKSDQEE